MYAICKIMLSVFVRVVNELVPLCMNKCPFGLIAAIADMRQ